MLRVMLTIGKEAKSKIGVKDSFLKFSWEIWIWIEAGPTVSTTWIGSKFGHQQAPLTLLPKVGHQIALLALSHCLGCPIGIIS